MDITHSGSVVSLNAGVSAQFFRKQLYVAVAGDDMLGRKLQDIELLLGRISSKK